MRELCLLICAGFLLAACGGAGSGSGKLDLKASGKDFVMDVKSGVMRVSQQDSSDPQYRAAIYHFTLANYDLNTTVDLMRPMSKPEERRVAFQIYGDKATNKDTPLKPGTYKAEATSFPSYARWSLAIWTFADGRPRVALSQDSAPIDTKGEVKITSVEGDTVKGEINITTGTTIAAKGNFTAKLSR